MDEVERICNIVFEVAAWIAYGFSNVGVCGKMYCGGDAVPFQGALQRRLVADIGFN